MSRSVATYILPLRKETTELPLELTQYLRGLSKVVEVVVVDNSPAPVFARHHSLWKAFATHVAPDFVTPNPKVGNVVTGVRRSISEDIVVADDDVRYSPEALAEVLNRLSCADIVRPQNYFFPLVWHAYYDTARTLLNRISGGDWPGTLAFRKSAFERCDGYAGNVLFENLELVRSIVRSNGRESNADDLFVQRLPPSARQFWGQRIRQAYDEFARPGRLTFFLLLLPALWWCTLRRRYDLLALAMLASMLSAEVGRRRHGGARVFPAVSSLLAPVWLFERAICSWIAVYTRFFCGGVWYAGNRLKDAAT